MKRYLPLLVSVVLVAGCSRPLQNPDKSFLESSSSAIQGAGAGALTGAQVSSASGPGIAIGAGIGALAGAVSGAVHDTQEANLARLKDQVSKERAVSEAQRNLTEQFIRRLSQHPAREIYPADLFFAADSTVLTPLGERLCDELYLLLKNRAPWSKLVLSIYAKSANPEEEYPTTLSKKRGVNMGNYLVKKGIEPRRIEARAVIVDAPILIDPDDNPLRYSQAVEIILPDK